MYIAYSVKHLKFDYIPESLKFVISRRNGVVIRILSLFLGDKISNICEKVHNSLEFQSDIEVHHDMK